jgi:hypothetical protein
MTQIIKKFITTNAIDGSKILLLNNEMLRGRNAANTADIDVFRVTLDDIIEYQNLIRAADSLPIPSSPKEYATIEYIENYLNGKHDAKDAVSYLAVGDVASTFAAGDSVTPASLVGTDALSVDGKVFGAGDVKTPAIRVALTGQTSGLENGIYDLIAASGSDFTLTRSADFDGLEDESGQEVTHGAYFRVMSGTAYSGYEAILTTEDPLVINTTVLTFAKYPSTLSLVAGDMLSKTGNTFSVDLAPIAGLESTNLGSDGGQIRVKIDQAAAEKDRSTRLDTNSGAVVAPVPKKTAFTLGAAAITNQYVDLPFVASQDSVMVLIAGGGLSHEGDDYSVNYTGGAGSKTRITFEGGIATGGLSALISGDKLSVSYKAFA